MVVKNNPISEHSSTEDLIKQFPVQVSSMLDRHAIISMSDLQGTIIYANEKFIEISGYKRSELLGKNHNILKSGKHSLLFYRDMWSAISSGATWEGTLENHKKDGSSYWVKSTISPFLDENGNPVGYLSIRTEISEFKQNQYAYQNAMRSLNVLSAINHILINSTEEEKLLEDVCSALVEHGGFSIAQIAYGNASTDTKGKKSILPMASAERKENETIVKNSRWNLPPSVEKIVDTALYRGQISFTHDVQIEVQDQQYSRDTGSFGKYAVIAIPLCRELSEPYGVLLCYAEQLYTFHQEEITMLEAATTELTFCVRHINTMDGKYKIEQQIFHSKKMKALGQLAAGIAHDINNILASIMGYTGLAMDRVPPGEDKLHRFLGEIHEGGERARDLIKQMLIFSHSYSHVEIPDTTEDILPACNEIVEGLNKTLPAEIVVKLDSNIIDTTEFDGLNPVNANASRGDAVHPVLTRFDLDKLRNILQNLVDNAVEAQHEQGEVVISVTEKDVYGLECDSCHDSFFGEYTKVQIKDSGGGIDENIMSSIFEPFFTTKAIERNSGIGLSTVHGLTHQLGGHIKVVRNDEEGACFVVYLRRFRPDREELSYEGNIENSMLSNVDCLRGKHVVVIDSDNNQLALMEKLMVNWGMQVTCFDDSESYMNSLGSKNKRPDILVIDKSMLNVSMLNKVGAMESQKNNARIVISSSYGNTQAADSKIRGDFGFIVKPIKSGPLQRELIRALER